MHPGEISPGLALLGPLTQRNLDLGMPVSSAIVMMTGRDDGDRDGMRSGFARYLHDCSNSHDTVFFVSTFVVLDCVGAVLVAFLRFRQ